MLGLWERVTECITDAAKELSYPGDETRVAPTFIEGRDVFSVLSKASG